MDYWFERGFMSKCAECGIDPYTAGVLYKRAVVMSSNPRSMVGRTTRGAMTPVAPAGRTTATLSGIVTQPVQPTQPVPPVVDSSVPAFHRQMARRGGAAPRPLASSNPRSMVGRTTMGAMTQVAPKQPAKVQTTATVSAAGQPVVTPSMTRPQDHLDAIRAGRDARQEASDRRRAERQAMGADNRAVQPAAPDPAPAPQPAPAPAPASQSNQTASQPAYDYGSVDSYFRSHEHELDRMDRQWNSGPTESGAYQAQGAAQPPQASAAGDQLAAMQQKQLSDYDRVKAMQDDAYRSGAGTTGSSAREVVDRVNSTAREADPNAREYSVDPDTANRWNRGHMKPLEDATYNSFSADQGKNVVAYRTPSGAVVTMPRDQYNTMMARQHEDNMADLRKREDEDGRSNTREIGGYFANRDGYRPPARGGRRW